MKTFDKNAIYKRVLAQVCADIGNPALIPGGCCLPFATHGAYVINQETGLTPILQAGSADFRYIHPKYDDGQINTHFSYHWDPEHPATMEAVTLGKMPEVHCWLAIRETREIVDFSTGFIERQALRRGLLWQNDPLPDFVWFKEGEQPPGLRYLPDIDAIQFILAFLTKKVELCRE